MKNPTKKPTALMPYNQRLRAYERDKDELLRTAAGMPAAEFQRLLDKLIEKWKI